MDIQLPDQKSYPRSEAIDRFGGSLVNIILGALILWVGQTTFRHAGLLASVNERFESTGHQLKAIDSRHEMLRQRVERATSETANRTRSRFTREDADKLAGRIKELQGIHANLERELTQRLTNLQIKVTTLETHGNNYQELAMLRSEVARLRTQVAGQQAGRYYPAAAAKPTYLPPVTQHR